MSARAPRHRNGSLPSRAIKARATWLALVLLSGALSGCMQTQQPVAATVTATPASKVEARPGVSPRGATVAIVAFDGVPGDTAQRFTAAFADAAQAREIAIAPANSAAYLARLYLTAATGPDGGVRLTYVCDLFDRRRQRAQRLSDEFVVPPRGPDPWAAVDDVKIAALATRSAQDLADALTNTPEAIAAAASPAKTATARPASLPPSPPAGTTDVPRQAPGQRASRTGVADAR